MLIGYAWQQGDEGGDGTKRWCTLKKIVFSSELTDVDDMTFAKVSSELKDVDDVVFAKVS